MFVSKQINMSTNKRRHELDYLRVGAILAVFFHHTGMPFNGDDFHIMNAASSSLLDDLMVYFEQFRLPLLFLISGAGTVMALSKRTWKQFLKQRTVRLLIPLFFGVLVIVPPQTYVQYFAENSTYLSIYKEGRFEVNHLWFIKNLYIITLFALPLILYLRSGKASGSIDFLVNLLCKKYGFMWTGLPLVIGWVVLKRYYPSGSSDLTNLSQTFYYSYFFFAGILLANSDRFWEGLKHHRRIYLFAALLLTCLFYGYYYLPGAFLEPFLSLAIRWDIWYGISALLGWTVVITILSYAQVYLTKPVGILKYLNEGIYPFYILHQTVIVVLAFFIVQTGWSIPLKLFSLLLSSLFVILPVYWFLIRPSRLLRLVFGMKRQPVK